MEIGPIGRFNPSPRNGPSPEQVEVLRIIGQGRDGRVPLPFQIWSCSPGVARALEGLATHLLPESQLTARETELAILVSAAYWDCAYVWDGHARAARALGLSDAAISAIHVGKLPALETKREQAIYMAATELQSSRSLSKENFAHLTDAIGHAGISDLTALLGFYAAVALILISYDIPGRPD